MLSHGSSFVAERLIFLMQMFKWPTRGTWNWAGHTCVPLLQTGHVTAGGAADGSCARVALQLCKVVLLGLFIMYHLIREMLPTFCNSEIFSWQLKEMLVTCYLKIRNILHFKKKTFAGSKFCSLRLQLTHGCTPDERCVREKFRFFQAQWLKSHSVGFSSVARDRKSVV